MSSRAIFHFKKMRLRKKNNSKEAQVHIINQASVPKGLSSHLTEASEKQKRGTK